MSIDLAREYNGPAMPVSAEPCKDCEKHVSYPTVYIDDVKGLDSLPESGVMKVRFKRVGKNESTDRDGKTHCSVNLDLIEILDVQASNSAKSSHKDTEDALDKLADEDDE